MKEKNSGTWGWVERREVSVVVLGELHPCTVKDEFMWASLSVSGSPGVRTVSGQK